MQAYLLIKATTRLPSQRVILTLFMAATVTISLLLKKEPATLFTVIIMEIQVKGMIPSLSKPPELLR